ncbi:hypothetical protein HK102_003553 [Quaeritorhiza haematococci]|nr:hypothetical protein HK102_003553 [Quaeritorhiza haematococci]
MPPGESGLESGTTPYKTVAIFGAFSIPGRHITRALLDSKSMDLVRILIRTGGKKPADLAYEFTSKGAQIVELANPEDQAELVSALKGMEVVISAIGGYDYLTVQKRYIAAAKDAGVKRFYPSEYGIDTVKYHNNNPVLKQKADTVEELKKSGLEYTDIVSGLFTEFLGWMISLDKDAKTAVVYGDENQKISTTPLPVLGQMVAESIHRPDAKNATVYTTIGTVTMGEIVALAEEKVGEKLEVKYMEDERTYKDPETGEERRAIGGPFVYYVERSDVEKYSVEFGLVQDEIKKAL